ncbi:MAG TPA: DUF1772 domain-containing protein [Thermoanaerobaculia bacterium]
MTGGKRFAVDSMGGHKAARFRILKLVNRSIESALRIVNLTTAGLLAGSLGFGDAALVPGWKEELPRDDGDPAKIAKWFDAIGPVALGTAVTLAIAAPRGDSAARRILDSASAIGLVGVLAATVMVTVPINKELEAQPASDYPSDRSHSLVRNWSRAHAVRTTLGIGAFVCAVAASNLNRYSAK